MVKQLESQYIMTITNPKVISKIFKILQIKPDPKVLDKDRLGMIVDRYSGERNFTEKVKGIFYYFCAC